jgi:SAM-dependent methyltransferase
VIATDGSPAMLDLASTYTGDALEIRELVLPDDPIPKADAIVSIGHVLSYLPEADAIDRALVAIAEALRPGGLMALDLCDFSYAEARPDFPIRARVGDEWAIITERSLPSPDTFIRHMTVFLRNEDGSWRRDDERHENVLINTSLVPGLLAQHGVRATVETSFGAGVQLQDGLHAIVGTKD